METEEEDWEDSYPPPQEESVDRNLIITDSDLWREAYTSTSPDLQGDLLETAARTYNKKITEIQKEYYNMMEALLNDTVKNANDLYRQNPSLDPKMLQDAANLHLQKERKRLKELFGKAKELEQEEYQKQVTRIRQWCEENLKGTSLLYPPLLETTE